MEKLKIKEEILNQRIIESFIEINKIKEQKVVSLFIKIIVAATIQEFYEKGNKISEVQSDWAE